MVALMGSPFAIDKLTICNNALIATGNQPVATIQDGSDEWIAVSAFYDRALPVLLVEHDWKFALALEEMERVATSNYPGFQDVYQPPADCLLIRQCYDDRVAALIQPVDTWTVSKEGINLPPMDWRIIGGFVHCIAPQGAHCFYVQNPTNEAGFAVGFAEALTRKVEAFLYQGFNEDAQGAQAAAGTANEALIRAREQDSSQEPRRILFRSPMLEARRRRRNIGWGMWG
jgi:hypothetical protein